MRDKEGFTRIPSQLCHLIQRSFDEPLDETEVTQLEQALTDSTEAREMYEDLAHLHVALSSQLETSEFCAKVVNLELRESSKEKKPNSVAASGLVRLRDRWTMVIAAFPVRAAAAVLAVGLTLGCAVGILAATLGYAPASPKFLPLPWKWGVSNDVVAKIESTQDVIWQASEAPETPPTRGLQVGQQVRLKDGWMQIVYRNGVAIVIRGPAVFEVRSEHGGKLFSGKLSAIVPANVAPFHIETTSGQVQIGTGQVELQVVDSVSSRDTKVCVLDGPYFELPVALCTSDAGTNTELAPGQSICFDNTGIVESDDFAHLGDVPLEMPSRRREPFGGEAIPLGNLFDDSTTASLSEAVESDRFQSAAETTDLGIAAVQDGGLDADVKLAANGALFSFANVGGGGSKVLGLPANDTYRSWLAVPIRTTGEDLPHIRVREREIKGPKGKIEDGVGISSNELLTFDLQELRRAGRLEGRSLRFVADRAGINDREHPLLESRTLALANLIVVVSDEDRVFSAYLNGEIAEVVKHGSVYSLNVDNERASRGLRYDGHFVRFDVPVPANARFLTLVSTSLGDDAHDHAVFSGARLVIEPQSSSDADTLAAR